MSKGIRSSCRRSLICAALSYAVGVGTAAGQIQKGVADARAYIPTSRTTITYPGSDVEPGQGWLSDGEESLAKCVDSKTVERAGTGHHSYYYRVDTKYELERALQVSASASGKYFGAGGSASYSLSRTLKVNQESVHVVGDQTYIAFTKVAAPAGDVFNAAAVAADGVEGVVEAVSWPSVLQMPNTEMATAALNAGIRDVKLSKPALDKLNGDPIGFLKQCGDSYITAVAYGGIQVGAFSLRTKDRSEAEAVSGSLGGSFSAGPIGGAAAVATNASVKKFASEKRLTILELKQGGSATPTATTLSQFEKNVTDFPTVVEAMSKDKQTPIFVSLRRYDKLSNWPKGTAVPASWQDGIRLLQTERVLTDLLEDVRRAIDSPEDQILGSEIDLASMRKTEAAIQGELNKVRNARARCSASPAECKVTGLLEDDYAFRLLLPVRKSDVPAWAALDSQTTAISKYYAELGNLGLNEQERSKLACPQRIGLRIGRCIQLVQAINAGQARLPALKTNLRVDSVNVRVSKWLTSVNRVRCAGEVRQWGCISPDQIEAYRARLLAGTRDVSSPTSTAFVALAKVQQRASVAAPQILKVAEKAGEDSSRQVEVECVCKTKENPSWCQLPGDFSEVTWWLHPSKKEGMNWDAAFLAEMCRRRADSACFCADTKNFRGKELK